MAEHPLKKLVILKPKPISEKSRLGARGLIQQSVSSTFPETPNTSRMANSFAAVPREAIAAGLQADLFAAEEIMLEGIRRKVRKLRTRGDQLKALKMALDHACRWAFVTGYKIVFDARIGLHGNYIAIFISFNPPLFDHRADHEDASAAGNGPLMVDTGELAQLDTAPAINPETPTKSKVTSSAIKRWVAGQILQVLLRIYRDLTFPRRIWFMEDWEDGKPSSLLIPYTLSVRGAPNIMRKSDKAEDRIIAQIKGPHGQDDLLEWETDEDNWEKEDEDEDEEEEEQSVTNVNYEDVEMADEDEDVDMNTE
ncbi:hypothetical protein F4825DRAFT_447808 [Nemania diffusa]|nr:hypothetical protein F4825DRAFT_447808 [Nemania diffusa]